MAPAAQRGRLPKPQPAAGSSNNVKPRRCGRRHAGRSPGPGGLRRHCPIRRTINGGYSEPKAAGTRVRGYAATYPGPPLATAPWRTAMIRGSQFRIFVWKGCIVPLAVQHCRYPSAALAKSPSAMGQMIFRNDYPAIKHGKRMSLSVFLNLRATQVVPAVPSQARGACDAPTTPRENHQAE